MESAAQLLQPDLNQDAQWMRRALDLAPKGRGWVEPNPVVGAVVVKDGQLVGDGWHEKFGGPHAEINALRMAGTRAAGATVYVTLEPCCHTGKTGPCAEALVAAGVARVVAAVLDPNPLVAGGGILYLRRRGVAVSVGVGARSARRINAPFFKRITQKRPYVIAKWAQSIDGALADRFGQSKWISCEQSRQQVHRLRGRVDAILIGINTALADDALLTARPADPADIRRRAMRCVLDTHCRLPLQSRLTQTASEHPVLLFHARLLDPAATGRRNQLSAAGVQCVPIDQVPHHGGLDLAAMLDYLGTLPVTNLLVEGGGRLLGSLLSQRLVDEAHIYIAPKILGDPHASRIAFGDAPIHLADAHAATITQHTASGDDVAVIILFN
jgi:diaminohydroxyphosphoribosylaminopyrimidine deaminase/5-amino-6-(5-phosphoribosylamino)uracil reductase